MKLELHDGEENVEHNGVGFMKISEIFAIEDAFFFGTKPFDRV